MASPDGWLADFTAKLDALTAQAAGLEHDPDAPGTTESAPDGSVSVSVAPNGALTGLRIDDCAWRGSGEELAREILRLARVARRSAVAQVLGADAVGALAGDEPVRRRPPEPPEPDDEDFGGERIFGGGTGR